MNTGNLNVLSKLTAYIIDKLQDNIMINAFRIAINGSLTQFNMIDGIVDEYEDESGIDNVNSVNESYNSTDDYYSPSGAFISNADIEDEDMSDISDWSVSGLDTGDASTTQVTFDGKSTMKLNSGTLPNQTGRTKNIGSVGNIISIKAYFDKIGTGDNTGNECRFTFGNGTYVMNAYFGSNGLFVFDDSTYNEVGTNIVVQDVWQVYTFDVDWAGKQMDVYLDDILVDSNVTIQTGSSGNETLVIRQKGDNVSNNITYIDWVKVGSDFITYDMTLISDSFTAEATPDSARIVVLEEDVDAVTLNTDLKAYASRDGGSSWVQGTLTDEGDYDASKRILVADFDLTQSGIGSGTAMEYKYTTHNEKDMLIHASSLNWD